MPHNMYATELNICILQSGHSKQLFYSSSWLLLLQERLLCMANFPIYFFTFSFNRLSFLLFFFFFCFALSNFSYLIEPINKLLCSRKKNAVDEEGSNIQSHTILRNGWERAGIGNSSVGKFYKSPCWIQMKLSTHASFRTIFNPVPYFILTVHITHIPKTYERIRN